MELAYSFTLSAPASVTAIELRRVLKAVEVEAQTLGFEPTLTFGLEFNSRKQREIVKRLQILLPISADKLKGATQCPELVLDWRPTTGRCHVLPNEAGAETAFGFGLYPDILNDECGIPLLKILVGSRWHFSGSIETPDPRYR